MTNKEYATLKNRANGIIRKLRLVNLSSEDLISETFLKHGYSNSDLFAKQMFVFAGASKTNSYSKNENKNSEDRICRRCGEIKPAACFRKWFCRGYLIFDSYCSECKNIIINISKRIKRANANPQTTNH